MTHSDKSHLLEDILVMKHPGNKDPPSQIFRVTPWQLFLEIVYPNTRENLHGFQATVLVDQTCYHAKHLKTDESWHFACAAVHDIQHNHQGVNVLPP